MTAKRGTRREAISWDRAQPSDRRNSRSINHFGGEMSDPIYTKPDPYAPDRSWWLEPTSREQFMEAAAKEHLRNRLSRAARMIYPITLAHWTPGK